MTIDFSNIKSILSAFDKILKLDSLGKTPPVPPPLIIAGSQNRSGLSATRIASRIIARKSETGVNPGPLPSGVENPDDIMIRIIVEEIIKDFNVGFNNELWLAASDTAFDIINKFLL